VVYVTADENLALEVLECGGLIGAANYVRGWGSAS